MKRTVAALAATLALGVSGLLAWSPGAFGADKPAKDPTTDAPAKKMLDKIIFNNGLVVQGEVLEETATQVTVMVHFGNLPPTKTTYEKSEIIDIQRGVIDPTATGKDKPARASATPKDESKPSAASITDPDAALVYLVSFEGNFGSDVSETPVRDMFKDVDSIFNDLIDAKTDSGVDIKVVDPAVRDKHIVVINLDCDSDARQGFDGIWRAEDIGPIFEKEIQEKHRRVVIWVNEAHDGAAFLPWLSPEIYFQPEGRMWISSDLEKFDIGDKMVDAKQISLRMGHAHGFAIDGGYDQAPPIIDAMALKSRWLCYRLEGGKPQFLTREPTDDELRAGWEILSDDGKGDNEDKNSVRFSNDQLVLDARIAQVLGVSKGTAAELEDLAALLGIKRDYTEVDNRGQKIFDAWSKAKEVAITQIRPYDGELWQDVARISVDGDYDQRKRARGQQITLLRQIRSIFTRFAEVWDNDGSFRSQIDLRIETLKQQQQADKASN